MSYETSNYLQYAGSEEMEFTTLCNYILLDAVRLGASDIHIEPRGATSVIRVRVDGKLSVLEYMPVELHAKVCGVFRVMCNLPGLDKGLPADGRASTNAELGWVTLRISIFPLGEGEKVVIRIFDPASRTLDLDELGFSPMVRDAFMDLLDQRSGLILMTGPTGSGKTTAIYAALQHLIQKHGDAISISTVEDPIEIPMEALSQAQLAVHRGFTYPVALRSLMRQDPDVVVIGEIRDAETASIAVQASLTGHLVISTIHAGNTTGVYTRLLNMGIEPFLLCSSIIGVLALRLIRQNCSLCAAPYEPEGKLYERIPQGILDVAEFHRGLGCNRCDFTGYEARKALVEMLTPSAALREAVMEKRPESVLHRLAVENGMKTLWDHGMQRVICGQTTYEEVVGTITAEL